ncbi:MAG TPA: EAL domain-containing protein [Edaphobacter sp.]|nr:EAL domain-containing protein [Edaphobacter sp.]
MTSQISRNQGPKVILSVLGTMDAYGDDIKRVLRRVENSMSHSARSFVAELLTSIQMDADKAALFRRFTPTELDTLATRVGEHMVRLVSPDLTRTDHRSAAESAGRANALAGVEILWLLQTFGMLELHLLRAILPIINDVSEEDLVRAALSRRIHLELEAQIFGYQQVKAQLNRAHHELDEQVLASSNNADLVRRILNILSQLPGNVNAFFARVNRQRQIQIEASAGRTIDQYLEAMEKGIIPYLSIDESIPAGCGPAGRAWRSRKTIVVDAWALDDYLLPWKSVGIDLGFRSSASMPLLDASGNSSAILVIYSEFPGYFSTPEIQGLLNHLKNLVENALHRLDRPEVVPYREQEEYRGLLMRSSVTPLYQPIIDLKTGKLHKLEMLARLRRENGSLISPLRFLPAFGESELLDLFRQMLGHLCSDFQCLEQKGLAPLFSINLPAEAIGNEEYERALLECTARGHVPASRVTIEILETGRFNCELPGGKEFVSRLREYGFRLAQDDLGAGYSSLLRMEEIPFDEIKIDQALVKNAAANPHRALQFILNLTRLAHACGTRVTVEGLESPELIEAAAILGADYGQGFGICEPVAVHDIAPWLASCSDSTHSAAPKTALGRMAEQLLQDEYGEKRYEENLPQFC